MCVCVRVWEGCEGATKVSDVGAKHFWPGCARQRDGADGPHHHRVCCVMEECFCGCARLWM